MPLRRRQDSGGIRIGAQAVVGANSVVLDDVPDGAVVVGAPARMVTSARRSAERPSSVLPD